jgi:hypothetical protein
MTDTTPAEGTAPDEREALYVDIANRAQEITGRGIWPSTVKAVLEVAASVSAPAPDEREALSGEGLPERFRFSRTVYGDVADDATRVLLALTDGGHADQPSDYLRWVSIRAAQALAARPAPAVNAADPDERERAQRYTTVLAHLNREQARAEAAEAEVDALRARIEGLAREYADAIPGFVRRLRAALADRPARGGRATDPLIVSAIRRHPNGTLRYEPANGPATGTSGRSFLAEYDAALAARPAPTVNAADLERELADAVVSIDAATERQMAEAASEDAAAEDMAAALDAANAETERLRAERFEAITALAWLAPNVTQDGRLSHAVRVVRDALTTAEAQRDEARAALAALRKWVGLLADDLERPDASTLAVKRVVAERLRAALAAAPSETEDVPTCPTPTDPKGTTR